MGSMSVPWMLGFDDLVALLVAQGADVRIETHVHHMVGTPDGEDILVNGVPFRCRCLNKPPDEVFEVLIRQKDSRSSWALQDIHLKYALQASGRYDLTQMVPLILAEAQKRKEISHEARD